MRRRFQFRSKDGRTGTVRVATDRDARACLAIVAEAVRERPRTLSVDDSEIWGRREWRAHRLDWGERGVSLVAELDGEVVGQLTCGRMSASRTTRHNAEFGITVARRARGLGVGRALLEALEVWAREHGVTRMQLGVFVGNERAYALYRSMGYVEEGVQRGGARFPEGEVDLIRMVKRLDERPDARAARADTMGETGEERRS